MSLIRNIGSKPLVVSLALCAAVCTTLLPSALGSNLLINGSFETGDIPDGVFRVGPPVGDTTTVTGWTVINGSIDYIADGLQGEWLSSDGTRSLDLGGSPGIGGVSQSFSTVVGEEYSVTFDMAGNPGHPNLNFMFAAGDPRATKHMRVQVDGGAQSADFSFLAALVDHTFSDLGWESKGWEFTATSTTTVIEFFNIETGDPFLDDAYEFAGPTLDNVSVTGAIPEPSRLVLAMVGLIGALIRRNRVRLIG